MNRRGITLIEIMVVTAVIGMLAILGVAGVMAAREQSRKTVCANHLRQIGQALQAHATDNGTLPPGKSPNSYSFLVPLLPYLDQRTIYNAINFSADAFPGSDASGINQTVGNTSLSVLLCPSDPGSAGNPSATSYAGNRGRGVQTYGYDGAFPLESDGPIGYSAFRDGTGTTAAVAEWVLGGELATRLQVCDARRSTFDTPVSYSEPQDIEKFAGACHSVALNQPKLNLLGKGESWISGEFSYTLYNHTLPPDDKSCTNGGLVQQGAWTSGSLHGGAVNTLFVDGHVRPTSDRISLPIWRANGSRNGGEVLGQQP